ncbi:hypothetical protein VB796_16700 [Arcicella sp. LKC2W]|uniref:hypothetical protein n=1 Tax=Arcicella sp. LKC2W TaxID=2984198 RepID=UPI002B1F2DFC|nr:hypothetical protein [Arcicella sp. LKC2W]MEA5460699.1 hypothetical protein [Arcicella sp. LKC2W]
MANADKIYKFILSGILCAFFLCACSKKYTPPNTKNLTYDRFIDISYIENIHAVEFLQYLESDSSSKEIYKNIQLKTAQNTQGESKISYLYDFNNRFVPTPLSINFAHQYCKWRSEVVTFKKNFGHKKLPSTLKELIEVNKSVKTVIKYAIPTKLALHIANETNVSLKRYNKQVTKFKVLTQETTDSTQLYLLRCTAVMMVNGKVFTY